MTESENNRGLRAFNISRGENFGTCMVDLGQPLRGIALESPI